MSGYFQSKGGLLSPEKAADLIDSGAPAKEVFARLDVEALRFSACVDDGGTPPLIQTDMMGVGDPVCGRLAFSMKKAESFKENGENPILVLNAESFEQITNNSFFSKKIFNQMKGFIFTDSLRRNGKHIVVIGEHSCETALFLDSLLIDNPKEPCFTLDEDKKVLEYKGGTLCEDDWVTIDPASGRLWPGKLATLSPSEHSKKIRHALCDQKTPQNRTELAYGIISGHNRVNTINLRISDRGNPIKTVGLRRTENDFVRFYRQHPQGKLFSELMKRRYPDSYKDWELGSLECTQPLHYRLVDLHGVRKLLPSCISKGLETGDDHEIDSELFRIRTCLYRVQLRNAFNGIDIGTFLEKLPTVVVPDVKTADEVKAIKTAVSMEELWFFRQLPENEFQKHAPLLPIMRFGSMMETDEALTNTAEIAPLCNTLCYGLNDATSSILKISRTESKFNGTNPFDVLDSRVIERVGESIRVAREVNPDIFINVIGRQISGHHIPSIEAVLSMRPDMISIPPDANMIMRALAAIKRFEANKDFRPFGQRRDFRTRFEP